MSLALYDPSQVIGHINGNPIVDVAPGTFIKVERNSDAITLVVGADGSCARVRSADNSGKVTFTVKASSPTNDVLDAMANNDRATGGGVGTFDVIDLLGRTKANAPICWVMKKPAIEFGAELGTREWVLETNELLDTVGGSIT